MSQTGLVYMDLDDEQSRIVREADGPMDIRDRHGNLVGRFYPRVVEESDDKPVSPPLPPA
jgi:hypothetical protein